MPLLIPIQPVPSQQVLCVLGGQNCQIGIYVKSAKGYTNVYVDLNSNGIDMCLAVLAHNAVPLDSCNSYDGFQGNLYFIDTQGKANPQFAGFNTRWFLIYLTPAEVALTQIPTAALIFESPIMTLSATLQVTSVAPGNFSVAHGLDTVPFLIEIIPTSGGAIWGQAGFADQTNVYLAASDTGITVTILVYTLAAQGLVVQAPAKQLLVESPGPGAFTVAHTLGAEPSMIEVLPTSPGAIWVQTPAFDATNVYLEASEDGQTATISVYGPVAGPLNLEGPATTLGVTPGAPGAFSLPHGLSSPPSRIEILMISAGAIWVQTPAFDGTNIYLEASDAGVMAKILVYS